MVFWGWQELPTWQKQVVGGKINQKKNVVYTDNLEIEKE
jgi:hypothetical protein